MIKNLFHVIFIIIAIIPYFIYIIGSFIVGKNKAFMSISQFLSLFPGFFGSKIRCAFYHLSMISCSQNCNIEFLTTFVTPFTIIGENVYIGSNCNISMADIGDDCLLGSGVMITSGKGQHAFFSRALPIRLQGGSMNTVHIGRDCWIGNGSIIMADVDEGCVIAAGSVVTKPIPPYSIAAGVPAKVIGERP